MAMNDDPRAAFDAALIPGMRDRLAAAYREFRAQEAALIAQLAPPESGGSTGAYRERDCPLCGAPAAGAAPVLRAHGITLLDCQGCGLTYTATVMDEAADAGRYRASALDEALIALRLSAPYLELETARAAYYLDRLAAHGAAGGRLLEIGSGFGTLLVEAGRRGFEPLGLEPGQLGATASRRRGATVVEGYFPQDLPDPDARFDAIAALDVLEHMASPLPFLAGIRARLAPGGLLFLQVPNWDSLLVRLEGEGSSVVCPGHWSYFTPATLPALLARAGFRALEVGTVQSEIDRQAAFPPAAVEAALARLRPGETGVPDVARLHALGLGYKLVGIFAPGPTGAVDGP
jgi:SAM-dependent methyltransferase